MSTTRAPSLATTTFTVVMIDDSEDMRLLVGRALERCEDFHVVASAADGEQGVAVVRTLRPHLVLLDIAMPVMDGLQALNQIRDECPDAIVVMLSGFGDSGGLTKKAMDLGAHGYVDKRSHFGALPGQLRVILAGVAAERADAASPPHPRPAT
jgi:DNA-binding NarL/FixJ family response regulator